MKGFNLYNLSNNFAFQLNKEGAVINIMSNDAHPLGFSTKEILSTSFTNFLSFNDKKRFLQTIKEITLNHTIHNEFLLEKKNKKKVWYKISLTKRLEENKEILVVLCTFIDDLKLSLIRSENRLIELNKINSIEHQIIHSTQAVIIQLDTDQNIVSVSKGAERILGYSNKELINKKWFNKIVPQRRFPDFFYGFKEFIQSKKNVRTITAPVICKDNSTKIVSWKTSKINISGSLIGTIAIGKEITEITKKVNLLKESETRFRTLAQLVQIPLSFISLDGKINFVNKAYTKEYGFKLNEIPDVETLLGLCYSKRSEAEKKRAIADWLNELKIIAKKKKIISKRSVLYTKKGDPKIVEYSAVLGNDYIYYSYLDVTAQIEKEQLLFASRENFKRIAENTPVAIAGCDASTFKVVFSNNQFKEVLGYSQNDINSMEDWGDLLVYHDDLDKEKSVLEWQQVKIELLTNNKEEIKKLERKIRCSNGCIKYFDIATTFDSNTIYALFYDITERKNAENKLKASEARFRSLAEQMLFPVSLIDFTGKFIFLNKAFSTKFGYYINDFPDIKTMLNSTSIKPKLKKIGIANWENEIKELFKTKTTITNSIEVETKSGEIKQVEYSASLCDDFVFYVYSDITEQKKAEKRLKDSETRFRNIVENLPVPLVSLNPITGDLFANKKHKDIIGYNNTGKNRSSLSEFSIDDLVDEKSKKHFKSLIKKVQINDENVAILEPSYKVEIVCKDKKIRTFEITENIFGNTLYSVFHDITEQLKANILLQESEQKFKALAENMPMAIGGYDSKGKVIFLNNHFTLTTGYVAKDVPTVKEWYKKTQPTIRKRQAFYEHWMKTVEDFRLNKIQIKPEIKATSRCKDGSFKHFIYSFSVYKDVTYFLIIDITEQERAKKELEKSHRELKSLASYLQDVREEERKSISREIHDELGQQITGIKMDISSIFKKRKATDDYEEQKRKEIIEAFNNAIKSVRKIATQLRPSILDDLGVIATFEWQIQEFKKRTGVECIFYYNIDENQISIDFKNNLFRILQESLTNITRHSSATFVNIDFFISGNQIRLIIADNGKGFNQNSPRETLGIIGMRERTSILNGTFSIVSEKMKGTRIIISIPLINKL
jgi:PAS domain S-box-containing protein